jgi:hypothetical protein
MQVAVSSDDYQKTNLSQMNIDVVVHVANNTPPAKKAHLIIAANVLSNHSYTVLNNLISALNPDGFILLEETVEQKELLNVSNYANVVLVAKHIDSLGKNYILLKKQEEKKESIIIFVTQNDIKCWLKTLKQALQKYEKHQELLLVCQGEETCGKIK